MKLLITGIPGTGKTTIGNYLQSAHGYEHFDIEDVLKKHGATGLTMTDDFIKKPGDKKVITWGFIPKTDDALVKKLQDLEYKMVWFDGNRDAARREFLKRGDVSETLFDIQMGKINKFSLEGFNPVILNTFDENGVFLKKEIIVEAIFEKCS